LVPKNVLNWYHHSRSSFGMQSRTWKSESLGKRALII
jgi:hypothetical protein